MEEKVLATCTHYNIKKFALIVSIIALLIFICLAVFNTISNYQKTISNYQKNYNKYITLYNNMEDDINKYNYEDYLCSEHTSALLRTSRTVSELVKNIEKIHPNAESYAECNCKAYEKNLFEIITLPISEIIYYPRSLLYSYGEYIIILLAVLIVWLIYLWFISFSLTVTDKRVYGKVLRKRVDLPLDSISAVSLSWLRGVSISTSSGKIKFLFVKNQNEIHSTLSNLLLERQQRLLNVLDNNTTSSSEADELKKYKELLDSGVITPEEFQAKKRQILNL